MASNDEKVVSLKFDNAQFEKNIKQSMNSLDEFDERCSKVGNSGNSMSDLQEAFSKTEITATRAGFHVRDVWLKVASVLEYQVARKIVDVGKKITDALTLKGIRDGLSEYEMQMNSVQTIMANTGANVQTVNKYLDELNEYADKTIYNFSQMTRNIGLFTAAGVGLKESTNAIKGIANLAAVSGSDSTKASMAMYQLSQALATGTVRLQDWNSVVNAGMGGKVFQRALIRTSEIMGTGAQEAIDKYGSFRDSLTKGAWLTSEVLSETLAQIAGAYSEAELAEKGYSAEQIQDILELAQVAESAATDVKTFTQLIDTIKEAIGSGWALTFRTIVGDFEEAKELYTGISKILGGIIDRQSDARNSMLQSWKDMGGRRDIINTLINLYNAVNRVVIPIKEAFNDIFGWRSGSLQLKAMTKGIEQFTDKLKLNGHQMLNIRKIFTAIFKTADTTIKAFTTLGRSILNVFTPVLPVGGSILDLLANIADYISNLNDSIARSGLIDLLGRDIGRAINVVANVIGNVATAVVKLMASLVKLPAVQVAIKLIAGILVNMVTYIASVIDKLAQGKSILEALNLQGIVETLGNVLSIIGLIAGSAIGGAIKGISMLADAFMSLFESGDKVETVIKDNEVAFGAAPEAVVQSLERTNSNLNSASGILGGIKDKIVGVLSGITDALDDFWKKGDFSVEKIEEIVKTAIKIFSLAASALIVWNMSKAILQLANAIEYLGDMFSAQARSISAANIKNLATSILYLTASLAILGNMNWKNLLIGGGALIALGTAFFFFAKMMNGLDISGSLPKLGATLLSLSASVLMLAGAVKVFADIAASESKLKSGVLALIITLGSIVAAVWGLSAIIKATGVAEELKHITKFFIGLSVALLGLAASILIYAAIPIEWFGAGLAKVATITGLIITALYVIEKSMQKCTSMRGVAATILAFAGGIMLIASAIIILARMKWKTFSDGFGKVVAILTAITVALIAMYGAIMFLAKVCGQAANSLNTLKIGGALLGLSTAILAIAGALSMLSGAPIGALWNAVGVITVMTLVFGSVLGLLSMLTNADRVPAANNMFKVAVAMGILALAINLMVPAFLMMTAINTLNPVGALLSMVEICGVLALLAITLRAINNGTNAIKTTQLIGLTAVIVALCGGIYFIMEALNKMDQPKIIASLGGLAAIIAAMSLVMKATEAMNVTSSGGLAALFGLALVIAALAAPLYVMQDLTWKKITAGLLSMAGCIIGLSFALKILETVNLTSLLALGGIAAVLVVLAFALRQLEGLSIESAVAGIIALAGGLAILVVSCVAISALIGPVTAGLAVLIFALASIGAIIAGVAISFTVFNLSFALLVSIIKEGAVEIVEALDIIVNGFINLAPKIFMAMTLVGAAINGGLIVGMMSGFRLAISAITAGCQDLENTFRSYWGINSPSTKMAELGGYLVSGLVTGINSGDATSSFTELSSTMENTFRDYWGVHSDSTLMMQLGGYLVSGLGSGIASSAASAILASEDLGQGVKDAVGSYVNKENGFILGADFGGGTLEGIQSVLSQYGLSIDMITGSSASAQLEQAQTRQAEIAKENKDAWNEYKEAMEAYGEGSVAADMAKQNWLDTVDANAEENRQLTDTIKNLETQIEEEETLAAAKEEQAAHDAEIAKQTSLLTDKERAQLTVEEQMAVQRLRAHKESLTQRRDLASEELERAKRQYQNHEITLAQVEEKQKAFLNLQSQIEDVDNAIERYLGTEEDAIDANEDLADSMDGVGKSAKGAAQDVEELGDSIQSVLDEYSEKWVSLRDEIFGNFNPFEKMEADTNEVGDVKTMLENLQSQINKNASWGAVQDAFYNRLEAIGAAVGNEAGADLAQDWLEGLSADSTEEIRALVNASDEDLAAFIQMWSDAYGQAGHLANIGLEKTKEDTEAKLAEMLDVVSIRLEDVVNVFDGTAESIAALQELANNDWYQKVINNVPLISDDIQEALEDGWSLEQLVAFGDGAVDNVNQALLTAVESQQDALTETGSELGGAMLEGVAQEFEEGSKSLATAEENMVSALADPSTGALLNLKENLEIGSPSLVWAREIGWWIFMGVMLGLWNTEDPADHQVELAKCMLAMVTYAKEWVDTAGITKLHAIGVTMLTYIIDDIGGMQSGVPVQNLKSCMDNLSEIACTQLESKVNDWYQVGVDLVQGLIDGMNSMAEALATAAEGLAGTASSAAKKALGEASPSKLWATFGVYAVEGLILGMQSQETSLEDSTSDIISRANRTAEMIAYTLAAAMADSDYEPTITPVVDLSEIQNGAYLANKMWNNSPASNLSSIVRNNEMETRKAAQYNADNEMGDDSTSGGINFIQNNYSPKALSRLDIYRQTRNQISQLKGALQR